MTHRNRAFHWLSIGGAIVVFVMALTAVVLSRLTTPPLPLGWTIGAAVLGVLGTVWYGLGARCALRTDGDEVRLRGKYRTLVLSLDGIEGFEPERSALATLRASGPALLIRVVDRPEPRRARGLLPNGAVDQERVLAQLNALVATKPSTERHEAET